MSSAPKPLKCEAHCYECVRIQYLKKNISKVHFTLKQNLQRLA